MYPNLKAEMARYAISHSEIAEFLGKPKDWFANRIQGKVCLDVRDAVAIRNCFFPGKDFLYLFATEPEQPTMDSA